MAGLKHYAIFRFYADLNDFLPERHSATFRHYFELHPSIKDIIESLGVPHTEIDLILVNGSPVDFTYSVQGGDRISVYPAFTSLDVRPILHLRRPLTDVQFVLDIHLGRLASYLRLLGFDSVYDNNRDDSELARLSHDEGRILVTRDTGLLKRKEVVYGYFVRETDPIQQSIEVVRRFDLFHAVSPFRRCLRCNTVLIPISKDSIIERLELQTRQYYDEFRTCPSCDRVYWKGSHYDHMQRVVQHILAAGNQ
jgi:uncharacterized protein with PIN domain